MKARRPAGKASAARVALVTGASRGLGRTIAAHLAVPGTELVVTARHRGELEVVAKELRKLGAEVLPLAGDLRSAAHRARLVSEIARRGRLDLLVNNASELGPSPLLRLADLPLPRLRDILEVNLLAPLGLLQAARPWLANARGLVVNISSDAALGAYPGWGGYGASKAALDLLSRTLAKELGSDGIAVVSVDPGDLRTQMHQAAFPGEDISDRPLPEVTLPFWAWLFAQEPPRISGGRFRAQSEEWELVG
ncbi:MAG: SDR family oxidoreductase [Thermoplasmata archaeon]|nr:SDR family oxidoreductase [Thermoplasmata archaeon]